MRAQNWDPEEVRRLARACNRPGLIVPDLQNTADRGLTPDNYTRIGRLPVDSRFGSRCSPRQTPDLDLLDRVPLLQPDQLVKLLTRIANARRTWPTAGPRPTFDGLAEAAAELLANPLLTVATAALQAGGKGLAEAWTGLSPDSAFQLFAASLEMPLDLFGTEGRG